MHGPVTSAALSLPPALRALVDRTRQLRTRTTADARLAKALRDRVEAADLAVSGVAFYVTDGVVSLYGGVPNGDVREAVIDVVVEEPAVQRVVDHLRIGDA